MMAGLLGNPAIEYWRQQNGSPKSPCLAISELGHLWSQFATPLRSWYMSDHARDWERQSCTTPRAGGLSRFISPVWYGRRRLKTRQLILIKFHTHLEIKKQVTVKANTKNDTWKGFELTQCWWMNFQALHVRLSAFLHGSGPVVVASGKLAKQAVIENYTSTRNWLATKNGYWDSPIIKGFMGEGDIDNNWLTKWMRRAIVCVSARPRDTGTTPLSVHSGRPIPGQPNTRTSIDWKFELIEVSYWRSAQSNNEHPVFVDPQGTSSYTCSPELSTITLNDDQLSLFLQPTASSRVRPAVLWAAS